MFRKLTLSFLLTVCAVLIGQVSSATTYIHNGIDPIPNPLDLKNGDELFVATGTYSGTISGFVSGATITIDYDASFSPSSSMPNNAAGTIHNYGIFTYTNAWTVNTGFTVHNYAGGIMTFGAVTIRGNSQTWTNYTGGTINFNGDVLMNGNDDDANNFIINRATINVNGNFQMNSRSGLTNYKDFNLTGTFRVNGGTLRNEGNLDITGNILMNNGASVIDNYCRMQATGGITNTAGAFRNYSYVWAKNSDITNSATFTNINIPGASPPIIHGRNFTQTGGSLTGPALMYFYGTTHQSGGTTGVSGFTSDTIKMNDITRVNTSVFYDPPAPPQSTGGIVNPNAIYNAWGVPDSLRTYLFGCSVEIFLEIPLAINWNSFTVDLFDNVPVLNWSAEFQGSTVFEIQRSYDNRNFSAIKTLPYEEGRSGYEYHDKSVNNQADLVYYRVKAIEVSGVEKYTQIRSVKFSHKPGTIYTAPNPFTSNFILNYRASEKETISIRMFNVSGQQMFTKSVTVNNGNNIINITEAAQLAKGIYVIQVSKGNNMIASGKLIKQ